MANPLYDSLFGQHLESEAVFLHVPEEQSLTYGDFLRLVAQYAGAFTDMGLVTGDRVAVQIEKSPHALAVYAACAQAGLVFLPLNTAYTPDETTYFVENSGAAIVLSDANKRNALEPIAKSCGTQQPLLRMSRCRLHSASPAGYHNF